LLVVHVVISLLFALWVQNVAISVIQLVASQEVLTAPSYLVNLFLLLVHLHLLLADLVLLAAVVLLPVLLHPAQAVPVAELILLHHQAAVAVNAQLVIQAINLLFLTGMLLFVHNPALPQFV